MANKKSIRQRGKLKLSQYFQELKKGDLVAISREQSVNSSFPKRLQGCTGTIEGRRGSINLVNIKDGKKTKRFLIEPIHLKKIK